MRPNTIVAVVISSSSFLLSECAYIGFLIDSFLLFIYQNVSKTSTLLTIIVILCYYIPCIVTEKVDMSDRPRRSTAANLRLIPGTNVIDPSSAISKTTLPVNASYSASQTRLRQEPIDRQQYIATKKTTSSKPMNANKTNVDFGQKQTSSTTQSVKRNGASSSGEVRSSKLIAKRTTPLPTSLTYYEREPNISTQQLPTIMTNPQQSTIEFQQSKLPLKQSTRSVLVDEYENDEYLNYGNISANAASSSTQSSQSNRTSSDNNSVGIPPDVYVEDASFSSTGSNNSSSSDSNNSNENVEIYMKAGDPQSARIIGRRSRNIDQDLTSAQEEPYIPLSRSASTSSIIGSLGSLAIGTAKLAGTAASNLFEGGKYLFNTIQSIRERRRLENEAASNEKARIQLYDDMEREASQRNEVFVNTIFALAEDNEQDRLDKISIFDEQFYNQDGFADLLYSVQLTPVINNHILHPNNPRRAVPVYLSVSLVGQTLDFIARNEIRQW